MSSHKNKQDKAVDDNLEEKSSDLDKKLEETAPIENKEEQKQDDNEKLISELTEKVASADDKLLRLNAEFENFRRRVIREKSDIRVNSQFDVINHIIPVFDHFDLALDAAQQSNSLEKLLEGMKIIKAEFERALSNLGVETINAVGKPFDPNFHEALAYEASPEVEKDKVLRQWRAGYKMGERLIRPASVVISSGVDNSSDKDA